MIDEDGIRQRWESIGCKPDERGRRLFAAAEVEAAGYGALAIVSKAEVRTLPLALQSLFDPYQFSWGQVMAGGVVIALPAVILFFIFRKQLVGGLLAGGVKG